jgi:hypothetical protein
LGNGGPIIAVVSEQPMVTRRQGHDRSQGSGDMATDDPWSQKELAYLRRLVARGETSDEIAKTLQRWKGDVWAKARELGVEWRLAEVERCKAGQVQFIAEYADGTKATFIIDCWTLQAGDHVLRSIARERQIDGSLKVGNIVKVYRDPKGISGAHRSTQTENRAGPCV